LNPNEHGKRVSGLFDNIATWYDFLNHFLSLGQDIYWRNRLARTVRPGSTGTVLDLAAGTLDVSRELLRRYPELNVLSMDFSRPMLARGQKKVAGLPAICPVQADGRSLPLPDGCVDAVTIAFGIRNILPRTDAYGEILRVLTPGGRLCILEFGTGQARIWQGAYNFYLGTVLPRIGRFFSKNPEAYQYLADTILAFPDASVLAGELRDAGFDQIGYQALSSGIVYIHVASKPL
jgi:demethylmenaquinone methyltransferase/2-methoxy-6-polyprenyl-1,4-benzoquinol methylase